jgi:hypothetical protein
MPATVRLKDIVDALEMQFDESSAFLDLDTGQVETVSHDLLREAEDSGDEEPDLPTWQNKEWEIAKRIVSTDRFHELPTKFEVHEWAIMQNFSRSVESDSIREDLLNAIHGPGAFRNFTSMRAGMYFSILKMSRVSTRDSGCSFSVAAARTRAIKANST